VEHFDLVYRRHGRYRVMIISQNYVDKVWTEQERRFALSRLGGTTRKRVARPL
jgi:hypothetical protein